MLEWLVTSKTRNDILVLLFTNPEKEFYLREISRKIGQQPSLVGSELRKLETAGLVGFRRAGRAFYYSPNRKSPIYNEVHGIVIKGGLLLGALRDMLSGERKKIDFAFVYGSFARGGEQRASDIDLMIIGEPDPGRIARAVSETEKKTGREINYSIFPKREFLRKLGTGFISHILKEEKIMIIGDEHELERFAAGG